MNPTSMVICNISLSQVKAVLTDRSQVELDLSHRKPRWVYASNQASLNIKKPTLRASYQYAGDVCLGITGNYF